MNRRGFMKSVGGALAALGLVREVAPEEPEEVEEVVIEDPIVSPETITVGSGHMVIQYEAEGAIEIGELVVAGSGPTKVKAADRETYGNVIGVVIRKDHSATPSSPDLVLVSTQGSFPTKLGTMTYSTTPTKKISVG